MWEKPAAATAAPEAGAATAGAAKGANTMGQPLTTQPRRSTAPQQAGTTPKERGGSVRSGSDSCSGSGSGSGQGQGQGSGSGQGQGEHARVAQLRARRARDLHAPAHRVERVREHVRQRARDGSGHLVRVQG